MQNEMQMGWKPLSFCIFFQRKKQWTNTNTKKVIFVYFPFLKMKSKKFKQNKTSSKWNPRTSNRWKQNQLKSQLPGTKQVKIN